MSELARAQALRYAQEIDNARRARAMAPPIMGHPASYRDPTAFVPAGGAPMAPVAAPSADDHHRAAVEARRQAFASAPREYDRFRAGSAGASVPAPASAPTTAPASSGAAIIPRDRAADWRSEYENLRRAYVGGGAVGGGEPEYSAAPTFTPASRAPAAAPAPLPAPAPAPASAPSPALAAATPAVVSPYSPTYATAVAAGVPQ